MAPSKLLIASLLISLFFLQLVLEADADQVVNSYTPSEPMPYKQEELNSGTPSEPMPYKQEEELNSVTPSEPMPYKQEELNSGTSSEPMPPGKIDYARASCARDSCVPPGTSGNQVVCPCHASLTTRGDRKEYP